MKRIAAVALMACTLGACTGVAPSSAVAEHAAYVGDGHNNSRSTVSIARGPGH